MHVFLAVHSCNLFLPQNHKEGGGGGQLLGSERQLTPQTNLWPEAPLGTMGGGGRVWGAFGLGGVGGGSSWGDLGCTCPQGQALVHHRLPLPPLALPLIKTEYWDRAGGGGNIRYEW